MALPAILLQKSNDSNCSDHKTTTTLTYITMKKFLLLLSAIGIIATACQTDTTTDNFIGVGNGEEGTTLTVSLAETRTSLGEKVGTSYPVYWSEEDKIVVNGVPSEEIQINEEDRAHAIFSFNQKLDYPYAVTYPYSVSTTAKNPIVELPAEQKYVENSFDVNSAPMCGYVINKGDKISLSHLAGVLRIPIKSAYDNTILDKVVLTATSGAKLAGEFSVDCKNAKITPTESAQSSITYTLPSNFKLSQIVGEPLYISVPAGFIGKCTIEFIEKSGAKMTCSWAPSSPVKAGIVREFKGLTYEHKAGGVLEPLPVEEDEFTIFYKSIHGHVTYSDGSPIANVAVSDGFQVVSTDSNGYYELKGVTPQTWYIYCSLPADVKVPIDELGRPCFFKKYPSSTQQYDFTFEKLPGGVEKEFALLALADVQPGNMTHAERFIAQATPEIKNYSQTLSVPCYGIALGDIISNTTGIREYLFEHIQQALSAHNTGVPIFAVYGNHDCCDFNESLPVFADERSGSYNLKIQRAFEDTFGPANYSFNRGNVHVVTLRNTQYNDNIHPDGQYSMYFTDEQYAWLQQDLALVDKSRTVVFCVHIPIFNKGGTHVQDVLNLLDEFSEAHVLSGHLHFRQCYDHVKANTGHKVYEQSWSSCGAVANGHGININCDGAPTGYGVITFKSGKMAKSFHKGYAYGMNSEDYQIRLHRGNDITGAAIPEGDANTYGTKGYYQFPYDGNTIIANVFSSDQYTWTVEVWKYDEATGARTTKIGDMTSLNPYYKIPLYEELVGSWTAEDPRRPADTVTNSGRDFWTIGVLLGYLGKSSTSRLYHECHTLWKYRLSDADANAKIMVVARDRWGNEYTETEFQVGTDIGYSIYNPEKNPTVE